MKNKKITILLLSLFINFSYSNVLALTKEETVYSKLDSSGKNKTIIVNDYLKNNDSLEKIEDYSDLENIINLSGNESFNYANNKLTWNAIGNNILYQGITNKALPINEVISYKLNGEPILIDDLIGKAGNVEITIKYINNDYNKKYKLYTPFVVTTTLSLEGNNNKNVSILNGKVVDNGNKFTIVGLSAPGLYESLGLKSLKDLDKVVISFETINFELPSIYSVITPKLIDSEDLNIFNKMDEMYTKVDKLQENMNILENNAKLISDNLKGVSDNTDLLYKNLTLMLNSVSDLKGYTNKLDVGLKKVLYELKNTQNSLDTNDYVNRLKEIYHKDYVKVQELSHSSNPDQEVIELLKINMEAIENTLKTMQNISNVIETMYKKTEESLTMLSNGATQIDNGVEKLELGIAELNKNVGILNNGIKELSDGTNKFSLGVSSFNKDGINELSKLKNNAQSISSKTKRLGYLADNYGTFTLSKADNKNMSTKFIYVVDSVKNKKAEETKIKVSNNKTFVERLKNLFK